VRRFRIYNPTKSLIVKERGLILGVIKELKAEQLELNEDWEGNNAAFCCSKCQKVFIVSGLIHQGIRCCPNCGKTEGHVEGGKMSGGRAYLVVSESSTKVNGY